MRTTPTLLWLILQLALPAMPAAADERPEKAPGVVTDVPGALVFADDPHQEFADSYQFGVVEHEFAAVNRGLRPVVIEQALAVRGDALVVAEPTVVAPGAGVRIRVSQPLATSLGRAAFRYALVTDEPGVSRYRFSLSGFVQSAYDPERPVLDLGMVDRDQGARASVELGSREVDRLELLAAATDGAPIRVETSPTGVVGEALVVTAILEPSAPLGTVAGTITLTTNVEHQPTVEIPLTAQVFGDLVPSEHPIAFGLVRVSDHVTKDITLASRSGRAFTIEAIDGGVGPVTTDAAPCSGDSPADCWVVRVMVNASAPTSIGGILLISTDRQDETVPLSYGGLVVGRETVIRQLDAGQDQQDDPQRGTEHKTPAWGF
jgi:hypothetical protein